MQNARCQLDSAGRGRERPTCFTVKPSPLFEGREETCIQNVFLRLPSAVPTSQQPRGEVFGDTQTHTEKRSFVNAQKHALLTLLSKQSRFARSAITDYVAGQWRMVNSAIAKASVDFNTSQRAESEMCSNTCQVHTSQQAHGTRHRRTPSAWNAFYFFLKTNHTSTKLSNATLCDGAVVRAARMERCPSQLRLLYSLLRPTLPFHEIFPTTLQKQTHNRVRLSNVYMSTLQTHMFALETQRHSLRVEEKKNSEYPSDSPFNDGLGCEDALTDSRELHGSPCTSFISVFFIIFGFPSSSSGCLIPHIP